MPPSKRRNVFANLSDAKGSADDFDIFAAKSSEPIKIVTFRATPAKHKALKLAAVENGRTLDSLLNEAADFILAKYGANRPAE